MWNYASFVLCVGLSIQVTKVCTELTSTTESSTTPLQPKNDTSTTTATQTTFATLTITVDNTSHAFINSSISNSSISSANATSNGTAASTATTIFAGNGSTNRPGSEVSAEGQVTPASGGQLTNQINDDSGTKDVTSPTSGSAKNGTRDGTTTTDEMTTTFLPHNGYGFEQTPEMITGLVAGFGFFVFFIFLFCIYWHCCCDHNRNKVAPAGDYTDIEQTEMETLPPEANTEEKPE